MQFLKICHILDFTYYKKNICKNIVYTILGKNNYARAREDMMEMGIHEKLWLHLCSNNLEHFTKSHATYVITPTNKQKFLDLIGRLRTPTDYVIGINLHVSDGRLRFMKFHDYHIQC